MVNGPLVGGNGVEAGRGFGVVTAGKDCDALVVGASVDGIDLNPAISNNPTEAFEELVVVKVLTAKDAPPILVMLPETT